MGARGVREVALKIRLGPAITDGKLNYLSVTAVDRFTGEWGCPRKWGWHTIDGIRPVEDTTARDTGTGVHEEIDAYQTTGVDRLGPIARAGKHFYYPPGPGILVEHESLGEIALSGVPFYVRLDLLNARDYWLDDDGEKRALVDACEVNDWKTTGDVAKRALSSRGLLGTTQMPIYGYWSRTRHDYPMVRLSHSYLGTRSREALKVSGLFTRAEVDDRVAEISRVVDRMKDAAHASSGVELEPDLTKCDKTRAGCPYKSICQRPQFSGLYALTTRGGGHTLPSGGDKDMASVLDRLKMKQPAAQAAPAPTPAPAVPAPGPPAIDPDAVKARVADSVTAPSAPTPGQIDPAAVNARVAALEAELAAAKAVPGASDWEKGIRPNVTLTGDAGRAVVPDLPAGAAVITSAAIAAQAASVLPPDAPKSNTAAPAADPVPPEVLAQMPESIQAAAKAVAAEYAAAQVAPAPDPEIRAAAEAAHERTHAPSPNSGVIIQATAPEAAPKAKRGRPPKATPAPSGIGTSPSASVPGVFVLVDTVISGADPVSLDEYFDAMVARMCEKDGIADVRMAPKDSFLAYGQWRPIIAMMVKAEPPAPGLYSFRVGGDDVRQAFAWALQSVPGAVVAWGRQ